MAVWGGGWAQMGHGAVYLMQSCKVGSGVRQELAVAVNLRPRRGTRGIVRFTDYGEGVAACAGISLGLKETPKLLKPVTGAFRIANHGHRMIYSGMVGSSQRRSVNPRHSGATGDTLITNKSHHW
jgi:hypothetical protein